MGYNNRILIIAHTEIFPMPQKRLIIVMLTCLLFGISRFPIFADDTTLTTCDFASLQEAVESANTDGGVITIDCDDVITFTEEILITGDVTIIGNNALIFDGAGETRFFSVDDDASLTLEGGVLRYGYANRGGAISNDGTLTITSVTFADNTASIAGAIDNYGSLTVTNSIFTGNSATTRGGALVNLGDVTLMDSTFLDNVAPRGSALMTDGALFSQNTRYENNTCVGTINDDGGNSAENADGCPSSILLNLEVTDCDNFEGAGTLSDAIAQIGTGRGEITIDCTGVIDFESKISIVGDVTIRGGRSTVLNGGSSTLFFRIDPRASLTLDRLRLHNGQASVGGAIENLGTLTISNSTFSNNVANGGLGGAIYNSGTLTISNTTFSDNLSLVRGGAIANSGDATITDSVFVGNKTDVLGNAIYNSGTLSSQNTHYIDNTCDGDITDLGGNVVENADGCPGDVVEAPLVLPSDSITFDIAGEFVVTDCDHFAGTGTLSDALAQIEYAKGVITFACEGTITFTERIFIMGNIAIRGEGKIVFDGGGTSSFLLIREWALLTLDGITLQNGGGDGVGAISNLGTLIINNSTFSNNSTSGIGGAIYNYERLIITNSTFSNNSAPDSGGAIYNDRYGGEVTITDSTFTDNSAQLGGAVYNYSTLTITDSTFRGNLAEFGGGIYNGNLLTILYSTIDKNSASISGGGVYNYVTGTLDANNTLFTNNSARFAGAFYNQGIANFADNIFTTNLSTEYGGAVMNRSTLDMTDTTFTENVSTYGGAISNISTLIMTNTDFTTNEASRGGAILNHTTGFLMISTSQLSDNIAPEGGALGNLGIAYSDNTHYTQNTCFGLFPINDSGGNTADDAEGCP
jgi:predicted outer membrane repeat protein